MTVNEEVGQRIREIRREQGLSQQAIADEMAARGHPQLLQTTVGKIESGSRNLRLDEAVQLAKVLNVSLAAIAGEKPVSDLERDNARLRAAMKSASESLMSFREAKDLMA